MTALPRLLPDTVVTTRDDGGRLVVELARPGGVLKKMSPRLYEAVALLPSSSTFPAWASSVAALHPSVTADQLEGLLEALARGGFLDRPVEASGPNPLPSTIPQKLSAEIAPAVRLPARPPQVRPDLRVVQSARAGAVTVTLPDDTAFELEEREYRMLAALDGTRDAAALVRFFEGKGQSFTQAQLHAFIALMIERGLATGDVPTGGTPGAPSTTTASPAPAPAPAQEEVPDAPADAVEDAPVDAAPGGAPAGATTGVSGSWDDADAVKAAPEARRRRWANRLKRVRLPAAVLIVLAVVAATVKYPLRVTYECDLQPLEVATLRAPIDGVIDDIKVDEGQRVKAGDILGTLANANLKLEVVKSSASLEKARAELDLLKQGSRQEELDRAKARIAGLANEANLAGARLQRVRGLVTQGVAPREEQERAAGALAAISGQLSQARAELKLLQAGSRPDDLKKKEAEIRSLEAQLEVDRAQAEATVLRTRIDGVVTTRKPRDLLHSKVNVGDAVFEVVVPDRMRVDVFVAERDFDVLQKGLPMSVKVAAYPTEVFAGVIVRVGEQVERRETGAVVRAEGVIDNRGDLLRSHMTGYAEITAEPQPVGSLLLRRLIRFVRVRFLI